MVDQQENVQNSSARDFFKSSGGSVLITVLCALLIWGLTFLLMSTSYSAIGAILALVCAIFGWRALTRIQPAMFVWMSWGGWLAYFAIKLVLSTLIGFVVAPFIIGKMAGERIRDSIP